MKGYGKPRTFSLGKFYTFKLFMERLSETSDFSLGNFSKIRINAQSNKGSASSISLLHYQPGVYNISDFKPMKTETRKVLDKCWKADCLEMAKRTGFKYKACHPALSGESHYDRALSKVNKFIDEHHHDVSHLNEADRKTGETLIHEMMEAHALDRLEIDRMHMTAALR